MQENTINEQQWTELLYLLTEERLPDGSISDKAIKKGLRLREVNADIEKKLSNGGAFTPVDFIRCYGILLLFILEYGEIISFPYKDVFEWEKFKKIFYEYTSIFDDFLDFKKSKGRPTKTETTFLFFLGVLCRSHNDPKCNHRYACTCNYTSLLSEVLELRLARSEKWNQRMVKGGLRLKQVGGQPEITLTKELEDIFWQEFKAEKMAVDRFWERFYGKRSPKLSIEDKKRLREYVIESLAFLSKVRQR